MKKPEPTQEEIAKAYAEYIAGGGTITQLEFDPFVYDGYENQNSMESADNFLSIPERGPIHNIMHGNRKYVPRGYDG